MGSALAWGALASSSLVVGALLAGVRAWPPRQIGMVLAFGAGALISAIGFELAGEGIEVGSVQAVAAGLGAGAIVYFLLDGWIAARFSTGRGRQGRATGADADGAAGAGPTEGGDTGAALALGAFLDGIPEQMVLGIGLAGGQGVSVGLVVAIFVSNLPEAIGSATAMEDSGVQRKDVIALWLAVGVICALASGVGFALADAVSDELRAAIDGFAAGALLVMLIDSMIPEATRDAGRVAGLLTTLGFAVAAALSSIS
jgi:zinc transporter, ZIP family